MDTSYLNTKESNNSVVRSQRKITIMVPVTVAGTVALRPVSVQFILSRPTDVLINDSGVTSAFAEIRAWIGSGTFKDEILNNEI